MKSTAVFSPQNQRRLWTRLGILLLVIGFVQLKPVLDRWTSSEDSAVAETEQAPLSNESGPELRNVEPTGPSDSSSDLGPNGSDDLSGKRRSDDPPADVEQKARLGELHEVSRDLYQSTAGLRYGPGSAEGHRTEHVLQHAQDDPSKKVHGVFEGDRDAIFAVIDEAWQKALKGGRDVKVVQQNDRTVYTIRMNRKVGYVGGQDGKDQKYPECRNIRIVVEDENLVVSAYPTKTF